NQALPPARLKGSHFPAQRAATSGGVHPRRGHEISMPSHGFVRVAAAVPAMRVGDCAFNAGRIVDLFARAEDLGVTVIVFPELSITGYTCGDLFSQVTLLHGARDALAEIVDKSRNVFSGLAVVGLPITIDDRLFNCAAVLHQGRVLGVVPKS